MLRSVGGAEEATVWIWNGKLPAHSAAFINSTMGRALDICDHISPGVHIGSSVIPAAMAAAEMLGGCSGKDIILAVAVGTDVALRLNLSEDCYDGFDPTGVDAIFASTAAVAKLMGLDEKQTLNALALAFNKCGGSFQSNIDGAAAVKVIEGWTAQSGVECARLAKLGITGPKNFLDGVYGYFHIFGRDRSDKEKVFEDLGKKTRLDTISFKKYPSCGMTQGGTEVILRMMGEHGFGGNDIDKVDVYVTPYAAKLVGKPFAIGDNPKVDAQFNVGYCVANAILRAPVRLGHFEPVQVVNQELIDYIGKYVTVISDESLNQYGHYTTKLIVKLRDGRVLEDQISIIPGTPGNALNEEDFAQRFADCIDFSGREDMARRKDEIFAAVSDFDKIESIFDFIELFKGEA